MSENHVKVITTNRRARFDYHVESKLECGIALTGTEVKSLRDGSAQLSDAYAIPKSGELWLLNAQIPPYKPAGRCRTTIRNGPASCSCTGARSTSCRSSSRRRGIR